jgi:alpha-tubulin suppressor-like RCC1 family protein
MTSRISRGSTALAVVIVMVCLGCNSGASSGSTSPGDGGSDTDTDTDVDTDTDTDADSDTDSDPIVDPDWVCETDLDDPAAEDAVAVFAGGFHTCALTDAGDLACWGASSKGQIGESLATYLSECRPLPGPLPELDAPIAAAAVSGGFSGGHTCVVTEVSALLCQGDNSFGQLGDGTTEAHDSPQPVDGLESGVVAVAAGPYHTCAVTAAGGLVCFGANWMGQLGDGSTDDSALPVPVSGLASGVVAVAVGEMHSCALTDEGAVKCFGHNLSGQLGDASNDASAVPVDVVGLSGDATAVTAQGNHSCALNAEGGAVCWGYNGYGQLGDGSTDSSSVPVAVDGLASGVVSISAGTFFTCAVDADGAALCWGSNASGQLGDGTIEDRYLPTPVICLDEDVVSVAAGGLHACAVRPDGGVLCWGDEKLGQLGNGSTAVDPIPVPVRGLDAPVLGVSAGGEEYFQGHACVWLEEGEARCFGDNSYGQLGTGTAAEGEIHPLPVAATGLGPVTTVSSGGAHTCAALAAGGVMCFGDNEYGQLGDGTDESSALPVAVTALDEQIQRVSAGDVSTCALTEAGGV